MRYTTTSLYLAKSARGKSLNSQSIEDTDFPDHASERTASKLCISLGLKILTSVSEVLNDVTSDIFFLHDFRESDLTLSQYYTQKEAFKIKSENEAS